MNIKLAPGKYVVAVSGGVDSVVLLHILAGIPNIELVVAHFDHGVRPDSVADRQFVQDLAVPLNFPFEFAEGKLGAKASEALARAKRYEFLRATQRKHQAAGIVTAHNQDDVLETAIINILRGTARRGLGSLRSTVDIKRPLLGIPKQNLIDYAIAQNLQWHEDSTNQMDVYLRNYIRHQLLPKFDEPARRRLLRHIYAAQSLNLQIDSALNDELQMHSKDGHLDRTWFVSLPHAVAREVVAGWLRLEAVELSRAKIERLVAAAKTYRTGQQADIDKRFILKVSRMHLALIKRER